MKTLILSILAAVGISHAATLSWDVAPGETPHHFNVYLLGTNGWSLLRSVTNATSTTFTNGPGVKVGITSVSADGWESDYSTGDNPQKPLRIRLSLQSSDSPTGPWKDIAETAMIATIPATGFVRGKMEIQ